MRRRGASLLFAAATAAALSPPNRSARKAPLRQATSTLSGGVLRAYDSLLKRRPLPTKMASSGAASALGDALAQLLRFSLQSGCERDYTAVCPDHWEDRGNHRRVPLALTWTRSRTRSRTLTLT